MPVSEACRRKSRWYAHYVTLNVWKLKGSSRRHEFTWKMEGNERGISDGSEESVWTKIIIETP